MALLNYDFEEMAGRVQHGLDRLTANFLAGHQATLRRDVVDFHGREHLDFEVEHDGHHLRVQQVGPPVQIGQEPGDAFEEFESRFDGRPSVQTPLGELAAWLKSLPPGRVAVPPAPPDAVPANPLLEEVATAPEEKLDNPLLRERGGGPRETNPFARQSDAESAKRRALDWLGGD